MEQKTFFEASCIIIYTLEKKFSVATFEGL